MPPLATLCHPLPHCRFDLRLYVLVLSATPLRVLLFKEGLARFCTEPYKAPTEGNMEQAYMHLTNFAINKHSEKFSIDDEGEGGHKRSVSSLMQYADGLHSPWLYLLTPYSACPLWL